MDFILDLTADLNSFLKSGGLVMWPLMIATAALWFGLAYRAVTLDRGSRLPLRDMLDYYLEKPDAECSGYIDSAVKTGWRIRGQHKKDISGYLDDELFGISEGMRRYRALVRTIVTVAPLAGLLGTVSGMIEMFDSLGSQTFYSQSGGIANGISQALFTTQFGLVIAVPGLILGRFLDRREDAMREEIDQIKEYFTAVGAGEEAV